MSFINFSKCSGSSWLQCQAISKRHLIKHFEINQFYQKNLRLVSYPTYSYCLYRNERFISLSSWCYKDENRKKKGNEIGVARENPYAHMTTEEKLKEASKDMFYLAFIGSGVALLILIGFVIYKAMFDSDSVYVIYSKAFKKCQQNEEIENVFGSPLKAYGYETGRRRREKISHEFFMVNGVQHLRLLFFIEGPSKVKGTVHVEMKKNEDKKYEYYYLIVKSAGLRQRTIVLEDNRQ